jgi:Xaa-Pro aminopeptidase
MTNTDFDRSEFDLRHKRARQAMEKAGIDLLIATSPSSINYLVGSRSKAYLGFQCLLFPLAPGKNTLLAKKTELAEHLDLSIADECVGHGGPAPEDPMVVLHRLLKERDGTVNLMRIEHGEL